MAASSNHPACQPQPPPHNGQLDPGVPQNPRLGPGPPPQPVAPRPLFYMQAPPPYVQYQWPVPLSYNPFAGFPPMGYGMVMPQFPPPPYMEAPACIMPHPHVQPVDYRRFLHPPVHSHCPPYQNINQTRRVRCLRETVSCEVQTEPPQESLTSRCVGSDSGRETMPCSPSTSSSSFKKPGSVEVEKCPSPSSCVDKEIQVDCPHEQVFVSSPDQRSVKSCSPTLDASRVVDMSGPRNAHCNIWSVTSQDCVAPVCSSSQQTNEVCKEIPDILLRWRSTTPQEVRINLTDELLPDNDDQLPSRTDKEYQSPVGTSRLKDDCCTSFPEGVLNHDDTNAVLVEESRRESTVLGLYVSEKPSGPQSQVGRPLNKSHIVADQEDLSMSKPHDDTTENPHYRSRKMNESVWSVESLAPFVLNKEWNLHNNAFSPAMVAEMDEDPEQDGPSTQDVFKANKKRDLRLSVPMSDSWLDSSTPAVKTRNPQTQLKAPQSTTPLGNYAPVFLHMQATLPKGAVAEDGSSEPVASQSPNQEVCITAQQAASPCSAGQEEKHREKTPPIAQWTPDHSKDDGQPRNQLCVFLPDPRTQDLSPGRLAQYTVISYHCNKSQLPSRTDEEDQRPVVDYCTDPPEVVLNHGNDTNEVLATECTRDGVFGSKVSEKLSSLPSQVGRSLNKSPDQEDHDDTTENLRHRSRTMNESVWSVESLTPFVPNKEWILQNGVFSPEMTEYPEQDGPSTGNVSKANRKRSLRLSSSDSVPMSGAWLDFSTPAVKTKTQETQVRAPQSTTPSGNYAPVCLLMQATPPRGGVAEDGSSEPVADPSPNQAGGLCSAGQEGRHCNPSAGERTQWTLDLREAGKAVQLCVPLPDPRTEEFSPGSVAQCLVICFLCNKYHTARCPHKETRTNAGRPGVRKCKNNTSEGAQGDLINFS
ncbi:uncharacterized protein LOC133545218 isoform X2 [Nerophis ophidion]|nr:uncharacterized protein LOC133545218 isoform X2 [Nerophis ophidion]XP_061746592.1 uncharacterized protein LOC133545218 isoform X2 [Nerophis ophidion]